MSHRYALSLRPLCTMAWLAAAVIATPALAAGKPVSAEAEARYQREIAACASAGYIGDREACRREAAAARADRGALKDGADAEQYQRNALQRCEPLPEAERADCRARMVGLGTQSGSAAAGGIYRELVTTKKASPAASASTK